MKSELLLLGGAGAAITLVVVYQMMDAKEPPMALPYVEEPSGKKRRNDPNVANDSNVVNSGKKIKIESTIAEDKLADAIAHLQQAKVAADLLAKMDSSGTAAAAAKGLKEVITVVKDAEGQLNAADPLIASVVNAAVDWGSKPENQKWAMDNAASLWDSFSNRDENFYKSLDLPKGQRPEATPWWYF
jgi:hypothetical protein